MINLLENKISLVDLKQFSNNQYISKNITIDTNPKLLKEYNSPIIQVLNDQYKLDSEIFTLRVEYKTKVILFSLRLTARKHCYPIMDRLRKNYMFP